MQAVGAGRARADCPASAAEEEERPAENASIK